ncbi:MAG: TPM domain-containing protein [Betaproteobacteria bacterium]|nr:TPM domain-containing protein [Betaproteobacteria bacterium]
MKRLSRIIRHLLSGHFAVKSAFPRRSLRAIEQAIQESEATHSGQIRFAVEASLDFRALLHNQSSRDRAIEVFSQLRVWDTEHNNGVLIYLLLADRTVEILADRGIHIKSGDAAWKTICHDMEAAFRQGRFEAGSIDGIHAVGRHLRHHFPGKQASPNELPDQPVVL